MRLVVPLVLVLAAFGCSSNKTDTTDAAVDADADVPDTTDDDTSTTDQDTGDFDTDINPFPDTGFPH